MITDILEKYFDELFKKYEKGLEYFESNNFKSLKQEKKSSIENKFNDLKIELDKICQVTKALKESSFEESNYKIDFELILKK